MLQGFYILARAQRRRRRLILASACLSALLMAGLAAGSQSRAVAAVSEQISAPYYATVQENTLIIQQNGQTVLRTGIDVRSLPAADQTALHNGIALADEAALARLLEDYGS